MTNNLRAIEKMDVQNVNLSHGPEPILGWVAIKDLVIDDDYQRDLDRHGKANVRKIAQNFNWSRFSPMLVAESPIKGKFAVMDGQHRVHAALACGIKKVPALFVQLTPKEQAEAFVWVNGSVTTVSPIALFKSSLAAGIPWAVDAVKLVEACTCKLATTNPSSKDRKAGVIYCIGFIKGVMERGNKKLLSTVLGSLIATEQTDPYVFSARILKPLYDGLLHTRHKPIELAQLCRFLRGEDLIAIERGVNRMREKPEYFRTPQGTLLALMITHKFNDFARKEAANAKDIL